MMLASPERALEGIERLVDGGLTAQDLLEQAAERIARVVPADGQFFAATDPSTTLPMGPGLLRNLPVELCRVHWNYEFLVPDYLKFGDIAWSTRPVADLHDATGGRPERSARWREVSLYTGFRAEVRMVFAVDGAVWGVGQLDRLSQPRFSDEEKAWLERVAPVLARGLRKALLTAPARTSAIARGPGLVLLDPDGSIASINCEAAAWLDEIDGGVAFPGAEHRGTFEAFTLAARATAVAAEARRVARTRVRTRDGVWLTLHASALKGTGQLAVIIELAKAGDVAPLIVAAYGLTRREVDVARRIARGMTTSKIASDLHLSPHTVRDHVKTIFAKMGVGSRGELVAKVFADNYAEPDRRYRPGD